MKENTNQSLSPFITKEKKIGSVKTPLYQTGFCSAA